MKKMHWRAKLAVSIITAITGIVICMYLVNYFFVMSWMKSYDSEIVQMNFEQASESLEAIIKLEISNIDRYDRNVLAGKFGRHMYSSTYLKTMLTKDMIENFEKVMIHDPNLYAMAQMNGDGETVVASVKKNRSGNTEINGKLENTLRESYENYPEIQWVAGDVLDKASVLYKAAEEPVLLGIRAMGMADSMEADSYIIVAVLEEKLRNCYSQTFYNDSVAMLLNENDQIISSTNSEELYEKYSQNEKIYQELEYELPFNNWRLVNLIPINNYQKELRSFQFMTLSIILVVTFAICIWVICWGKKYAKPIQQLMDNMELIGQDNFEIKKAEPSGISELDDLNEKFCEMVEKLEINIQNLQIAEQEKAAEELKALQYQINPHFLYNSLNSIRWMALMMNNTKVADAIVMLSKTINPVFRNNSLNWKIKDELDFLENYIGMMRVRYMSCLEYKMDCDNCLYEKLFPRFILQPVIENCFVHNDLGGKEVVIYVRICKEGKGFRIIVRNKANNVNAEELERVNEKLHKSREETRDDTVGLRNVLRRLKYLHEENDLILKAGESEIVTEILIWNE